MVDALIATNKRAGNRGLPLLYSNGQPWLNSAGDPTVAFLVNVTAQNLFSLLSNPSDASSTTVYKCWFIKGPPPVGNAWAIKVGENIKACQFIKYEMRAGVFVAYFKHAN